ncbi:MAG: Flp pilus assembly protein CpaB [Anaerolineae bacterium]
MRRRGRLLILFGLIMAVIAGALTLYFFQTTVPEPVEAPPETVDVVVAIQTIPERTEVLPEHVGTREFDVAQVPANALRTPEEAIGKTALFQIAENQIIVSDLVVDPARAAELGKAAFAVEEGFVAFAVPVQDQNIVAGAIQANDRVDVLVTAKFRVERPLEEGRPPLEEEALVTQLTLQDVRVIHVGPWIPPPPPIEGQPAPPVQNFLTLMVPQQNALVLLFLRDDPNVTFDFALRGIGDLTEANTDSVTLDFLLDRYDITVPAAAPIVIP